MNCETCKFFKARNGKYIDWCGECHRYPPKMNMEIVAKRQLQLDQERGDREHVLPFDDLVDYSFFPAVEESDFCGEYQEKI